MTYQKFNEFKGFLEKRKPMDRMFSKSKVKKAHYASGGIGCVRQGVYEFTGTPELSTDVSGRMIFGLGDAGQEVIEREFIASKIMDAREQSIEFQDERLQHPFSMRIDCIITLPKELDELQLMRPLEIKTSSSSQFYTKEYKSWGDLPAKTFSGSFDEPKSYHLQQLNLYLRAMNVDWGLLVVVNRDDGNYVAYKVSYDNQMYEDVVAHCAKVEAAVNIFKSNNGELPPRIVENLPLTVYKRDTEYNKIGDAKLEKSAFPCIYQNKESGRFGLCKFFDTCHKDTLDKLGLTMEAFKC